MLFTEKLRPRVDILQLALLEQKKIEAEVARLDLVDPVISGNKWFKLKEYIGEALKENKTSIATFGGPFSNHIIATAAICKKYGLTSIGIIRGDQPKILSTTLKQVIELGMILFFSEREKYKSKEIPQSVHDNYPGVYVINEGGYGLLGMKGAASILQLLGAKKYTHILAAVGTGTTLAGLVESSEVQQQVIGISSMKNNFELESQINHLVSAENKNRFQLLHGYHVGGYAKFNSELIHFMNNWYLTTNIPSDFVYTGKLFFAFSKILERDFFPPGSKILLIHSGGLQGNNSLKNGTLIF